MKQLLVDYTYHSDAKLVLSEGRGNDGRIRLRGKLQEAEQKNGNGRVYPRDVLAREAEKYVKGPIANKNSMGELDHPDATIINLSNVSHLITEIWWEGNDLMGELLLLNTPSGKIAQELVLAGIPLGISSRGMGSVQQMGEAVEVQDDFDLLCWDLVSVPSTPNAFMRRAGNSLKEGKIYNNGYNKYQKVHTLITEIICNMTGICPLCPDKND